MSRSSGSSSPAGAGPKAGFLSSAMPHFGQLPGRSDSTPGHMGQKYIAPFDGTTFSSECPWPQQLGFGTTGSVWQQLCFTGFGWQQDFGSGAGSLVFIRKMATARDSCNPTAAQKHSGNQKGLRTDSSFVCADLGKVRPYRVESRFDGMTAHSLNVVIKAIHDDHSQPSIIPPMPLGSHGLLEPTRCGSDRGHRLRR